MDSTDSLTHTWNNRSASSKKSKIDNLYRGTAIFISFDDAHNYRVLRHVCPALIRFLFFFTRGVDVAKKADRTVCDVWYSTIAAEPNH